METNIGTTRNSRLALLSRTRRVAFWVLQVAFGAFFIMSGVSKFAGASDMVALFEAIGFGHWFRFLTGAIEVAGGTMLLVPLLAGFGAVALAAVMLGATLTHLFILQESPMFPLALLMVACLIAWVRRDRVSAVSKPKP